MNRLTLTYISSCRRRADDTRRILLVITVECLFAIVNSWFSDILLALIYCKRNFSAGDDCPQYLKQNYDLLVLFDLFNSISNLVLHSLCSRHFRHELHRMFQSFFFWTKHCIGSIWCCYCQIRYRTKTEPEQCVSYHATLTKGYSSDSSSQHSVHLKIKPIRRKSWKPFFTFQWYFSPRPFMEKHRQSFMRSRECTPRDHPPHKAEYQSTTLRSDLTRPAVGSSRSIKLYQPSAPMSSLPENKLLITNRR